jgi:ABC-type glycerol-3-phosphate transport system permease component
MNMVITLTVALPAAYAFSRFKFVGDKHLFFWLLTNRMAPPAVFLLPFFQLYSSVGLFDTHIAVALAHCLFNVPLAVWILEGFMSSVPREIDETAYIDGYSFPKFFIKIFLPMIRSGIGVSAFFLLHVQLGRATARSYLDLRRCQADFGSNDAYSQCIWYRLGRIGGSRRADHSTGYFSYLVR